ncbi:DUF3870 domain-containing protein [Marinisporobacter balticus]|uniref:Uncharacterized protein DUF3870 n=1 Tax=Marinisporobacter balticus TaxID=2018667 RepID=A0A4R2L0W7_9FIRM|nr:DUF3870 domain-containing protein [Marinisporobacter balticus]TCO72645.1 uncharacterized protein DUF3870 [Marinisporobacter balticus]
MYNKNTVYIIGHGKTNIDNAITDQFKIFFIGFVIDTLTDEVVDAKASATIEITSEFISSIFIGKTFDSIDVAVEQEIKRRYFGSSQRAIIISYKDAVRKYKEVKEKYYS